MGNREPKIENFKKMLDINKCIYTTISFENQKICNFF